MPHLGDVPFTSCHLQSRHPNSCGKLIAMVANVINMETCASKTCWESCGLDLLLFEQTPFIEPIWTRWALRKFTCSVDYTTMRETDWQSLWLFMIGARTALCLEAPNYSGSTLEIACTVGIVLGFSGFKHYPLHVCVQWCIAYEKDESACFRLGAFHHLSRCASPTC